MTRLEELKIAYAALFVILLSSCTIYNACRPMQVGMKWVETEKFSNMLDNKKYEKNCEYTKVTETGDYSYECSYGEVNSD